MDKRPWAFRYESVKIGEITSETEGWLKWNIENFRERWEHSRGEICYSPRFTYFGVEFNLTLRKEPNSTNILIGISSHDLKDLQEFFVEFQLLTECNTVSDVQECLFRFYACYTGVQTDFTKFLSKDLKTTLYDHLEVRLRVRHLTGTLLLDEFQTITKVLKDLKSLLATGENSDVTLVVSGKELPAHKNILCARSPVFKAMLCHDTAERESSTVNISDCDSDSFVDFLTYVYTGSTRHIATGNVISLYTTSDKYLMHDLKKACVSFMKESMSVEEFCDIVTLALRHGEKELVESSTNFFCNNSKEITSTENWVTFLEENPKEANEHFIKPLASRLK